MQNIIIIITLFITSSLMVANFNTQFFCAVQKVPWHVKALAMTVVATCTSGAVVPCRPPLYGSRLITNPQHIETIEFDHYETTLTVRR